MELRDLRHANSENVVHLIVCQSCADAKLVYIDHSSGEFIAVAPHNLLRRRSCSGDLVSKVFGINANNAADIRIRSVKLYGCPPTVRIPVISCHLDRVISAMGIEVSGISTPVNTTIFPRGVIQMFLGSGTAAAAA
jgi:hypothetical protein